MARQAGLTRLPQQLSHILQANTLLLGPFSNLGRHAVTMTPELFAAPAV